MTSCRNVAPLLLLTSFIACSGSEDPGDPTSNEDASAADTSTADGTTADASRTDGGASVDASTAGDSQVASDARADVVHDSALDVAPATKALGSACAGNAECTSGSCVDAVCCNVACAGLCEACVATKTGGVDGTCKSVTTDTDPDSECAEDPSQCKAGTCNGAGACKPATDGTECRAVAGECDLAETCSGGSCPADSFKASTIECRASGGECDVAERCTGTTATCPSDTKAPDTTECRGSGGVCDVAERCDGTTNDCPTNVFVTAGMTCGTTYACSGSAALCPTTCTTDTQCDENAICTTAHVCVSGRRAFTTSATYNGNLGGILGADAKCQALATAANHRGTYKAWLSDDINAPAARLTRSPIPYVMQDGTTLANDWADLIDGTIQAPFQVNEVGATVASNIPWTATLATGAKTSPNCTNWTSSANVGVQGYYGSSTVTNTMWTQNNVGFCNVLHRLYCFQQ